jgi:succinate dehydrogenase/fumarate reductase flavoprotein subunit
MSVGSIAAAGTPDQHRLGIIDTTDSHFHDYQTLSGSLAASEDQELVRLLIDNVPGTVKWLRSIGVEFFGPVEEPPHAVPRLLTVLPGSRSYIYHLRKRALKVGVDIQLKTRAQNLCEEGSRIIGVQAETAQGATVNFYADRGVILASGDFSASTNLKRDWISETVSTFQPVNPFANGDAQVMASARGASVLNASLFDVPSMRLIPPASAGFYGLLQKLPPTRLLTRPIKWGLRYLPKRLIRPLMMGFVTTYLSPREALFTDGAILVDTAGVLKSDTSENINLIVASLGESGGYIVGDKRLRDRYSAEPNYVATAPGVAHAFMPDFRRGRKDVYLEANSLGELATRLRIPSSKLEESVAKSNAARLAKGSAPQLEKAPFFALGPVRGFLLQTNGGLKINARLEVTGVDSDPIPGLYAVGNAGQGGLALFGHGHHLGWAFTSGRLAGRIAATNKGAGAPDDRATEQP